MGAKGQISLMQFLNGERPIVRRMKLLDLAAWQNFKVKQLNDNNCADKGKQLHFLFAR